VVNVSSGAIGEPASVQNSLDALFAMEKQLVFQVFDRLGVTLTPAERQLVERRPTQNMEAFLAYSRGLMALDDGRFQDATRFFDNARTLDPGFGAAAARYQAVQAAAASGDASASSIEASATGTAELRTVDASVSSGSLTTTDALSTTLSRTASDLNPSTATEPVATTSADRATTLAVSPTPTPTRDPTTTTTNIDRPAPPQGTVTIIIRRP
jgi:hypothetical protein